MEVQDNKMYRVEEVSELLGVTRRTVWNAIRRGDIHARRIGRRLYVLGSDLKAADRQQAGQVQEPAAVQKPAGWKLLGHELPANQKGKR